MPEVTALMSVYNGEKYLRDTINSVLNQSFKDFELIIINDGSTDSTLKILEGFHDNRIKLYNLKENHGVGSALDFGLAKATGKYLAKVDGDDLYSPERFEKQVSFLRKNKDIDVLGSLISFFPDNEEIASSEMYFNLKNNFEKQINSIITSEQIKKSLYWFICLPHTSMMSKTEVIKKVGYDKSMRLGEDYLLLYELNKQGTFMFKLDEVLAYKRVSKVSTTVVERDLLFKVTYLIKKDIINSFFLKKYMVFIWGASRFGEQVLQILRANNFQVDGFIDNDQLKQGTKLDGLLISSPELLMKENIKVIVASDPGRLSIINQLECYGFRHLQDYVVF